MIDSRENTKKKSFRSLEFKDPRINIFHALRDLQSFKKKTQKEKRNGAYRRSLTFT